MQKIQASNIKIVKKMDFGAFSDVYLCRHNDEEYAYKKFICPEEMFRGNFVRKLNSLSKLEIPTAVLPQYLVTRKNQFTGYLMPLKDSSCEVENKEELIEILRETKKAILDIHGEGIIHTDIHSGNIITDENGCYLLDFDNCAYREFMPNYNFMGREAKKYVRLRGLNQDLDIFMFNLLTFSVIKDVDYDLVFRILLKNRKNPDFYTSKEEREISEALLLTKKRFNNDFLIDTYTK